LDYFRFKRRKIVSANPSFYLQAFGLPLLKNAATRSISAENPNGAKGGGARAVPEVENAASDLGRGWKVRPCITLPAGKSTSLAEIDGPGVIQHIWITVDAKAQGVFPLLSLACKDFFMAE